MNFGELFETMSLWALGSGCKLGSVAGPPADEGFKIIFRSFFTGVISGIADMPAVTFSIPGGDNRIGLGSVSSLKDGKRGIKLTWGALYNAAVDKVCRPSGESRAEISCDPSLVPHSRSCCCI